MFEKKWSDEQNKEILGLHGRISNKEIAEKFGISASAVSKRVSHLKKLGEKLNLRKKSPVGKDIGSKVEVLTAPSHDNADELMKEYKVEPINNEFHEKIDVKKEEVEDNKGGLLNWTGVSSTITTILDKRFVANGLEPLTNEEKELFADALNKTLEIRAKYYFQYADIVNLGLAGFSIMTPRILEFLERKNKAKKEIETSATIDFTEKPEEAPQIKIIDEQAEATRRYQEMMTKQ